MLPRYGAAKAQGTTCNRINWGAANKIIQRLNRHGSSFFCKNKQFVPLFWEAIFNNCNVGNLAVAIGYSDQFLSAFL